MTDIIKRLTASEEQYTPGDMADQGAQGWRDGYAWAKGEGCLTDHERLQAEAERLQAECEKLRKDAERYRWLREYFCSTREDLDDLLVEACGGNDPSKLDEVIDTTMQGDQP